MRCGAVSPLADLQGDKNILFENSVGQFLEGQIPLYFESWGDNCLNFPLPGVALDILDNDVNGRHKKPLELPLALFLIEFLLSFTKMF